MLSIAHSREPPNEKPIVSHIPATIFHVKLISIPKECAGNTEARIVYKFARQILAEVTQ
jgi:hypothetical protein